MNHVSKEEMLKFLKNHFTYNVMNSWNKLTSFAANVKIYKVIPPEYRDTAYDLVFLESEYTDDVNTILYGFENELNSEDVHEWSVGFSGQSNGYIVLSARMGGRLYSNIDDIIEYYDESDNIGALYNIVKKFDTVVERVINLTIEYCKDFEVVEQEVQVTKKVKCLKPKEVA